MSCVGFVRTRCSAVEGIKEAIAKSLDLIAFGFKDGVDNVVIKPNMCYYFHPSTGEVTAPLFVSSLIDLIRERASGDPKISIVESDASAMKCRHAFKMLGYDELAREKEVSLMNLSEQKSHHTSIEINGAELHFEIPEIFRETTFVINVPKPKYMSEVRITCALKNMYGCNSNPKKYVYHKQLVEAIVGINKLIRTDLVLVDGLIVSGKSTRRLGLILSSTDPVATDVAASKLMGINPRSVEQIVLAAREGLGNAEVSFVGDVSQSFSEFPRKTLKDKLRGQAGSLYLSIFS